jgi:hypothetical protein
MQDKQEKEEIQAVGNIPNASLKINLLFLGGWGCCRDGKNPFLSILPPLPPLHLDGQRST